MAPTFFAQLAAGCLLVVGLSDIRNSGRKYLRLMAIVSLGLTLLAFLFFSVPSMVGVTTEVAAVFSEDQLREMAAAEQRVGLLSTVAFAGLAASFVFSLVWLAANAFEDDQISSSQRIWSLLAGLAAVVGGAASSCTPDLFLPGSSRVPLAGLVAGLAAVSIFLGSLVLGGVTAGMLLGHRYLTDTDMPIAPLRRLTNIYLIALIVRLVWVAVLAWPIYGGRFAPSGGAMWFWVVLTIRGGVGLLGAAIFAWMIRDCVKSRATQSATAIFYLSMVFVYLGELAAQYLLRTEGLAV